MNGTELIAVTQLPVIVEHLESAREAVEARTNEAMAMAVTADTVQAVKTYRTDLKREFNELETLRKAIKQQILAPYEEFEAVYRRCVADPYTQADATLRDRIVAVEDSLRKTCESYCRDYFDECCRFLDVDGVQFEQLGIRIGMTEAKQKTQPPKKIKDQIRSRVEKIASDLDAITRLENSAEILAEYRQSLSLSDAVNVVTVRKQREQAAAQQAQQRAEALQNEQMRQQAMLEQASLMAPGMAPLNAPTVAPANEGPAIDDPVFERFSFTVFNERQSRLVEISHWLERNGYQYE